jgi:hypothetical protein|nr:MAG TPA: hypothetical protein [Caudoviricetes sp.]
MKKTVIITTTKETKTTATYTSAQDKDENHALASAATAALNPVSPIEFNHEEKKIYIYNGDGTVSKYGSYTVEGE